MIRRRTACLGVLYLAPLLLYGSSVTRSLQQSADAADVQLTFWDVTLAVLGSGYNVVYWVLPAALWAIVTEVTFHTHPEHLIRYPSRTAWVCGRMLEGARAGALLTAGLLAVALVLAAPFPWAGSWSSAAANEQLLASHPAMAELTRAPALSVLVQSGSLVLGIMALTGLVAAVRMMTSRLWIVVLVACLALLWTIVSFRIDGGPQALAPANYLLSYLGAQNLPWGAASALLLLPVATGTGLLAGGLLERLHVARRLTLRRTVVFAGVSLVTVVLAVQHARRYTGSPTELLALVLAGPSPDGFSYVPFATYMILILGFSYTAHAALAERLDGTLHQELVRAGSMMRWWWPLAARLVVAAGLWALALAVVTLMAARAATDTVGEPVPLLLVGFFVAATTLQLTIYSAFLFLSVWVSGRFTGAAYALGICLLAAIPLGRQVGYLPSGLSGLGEYLTSGQLGWLPVGVLLGWSVLLAAGCVLALRRLPEFE